MAILYDGGGVTPKKTTVGSKTNVNLPAPWEMPNAQEKPFVPPKAGATSPLTSQNNANVANQNTGLPTSPAVPQAPQTPQTDYGQMIRDAIRAQQEAEAERIRAQVNQGVNSLSAQRPDVEKGYQSAAQDAYVQNMMSKKNLPQALAAQGLGGGVHESSYVDLENTYGNNLNLLRDSRDNALGAIDRDVANLRTSGDLSLADNAGRYSQMLLEAELQAKAEQLAAQNKYLQDPYIGDGTATRRLTYAQALELAKQTGFSDPAALSALNSYGVDIGGLRNAYDPLRGTTARAPAVTGAANGEVTQKNARDTLNDPAVRAWIDRMEQAYPANNPLAPMWQQDAHDLRANALLQAVQQGQLTRDQAGVIALSRYGFSLNF